MIYSLQDETNSEYKHLVNSRFELFRKQDKKFCQYVYIRSLFRLTSYQIVCGNRYSLPRLHSGQLYVL